MQREAATQLLNKLVDDHILRAKEEVEREIEVIVDGQVSEIKQLLMDMMDRMMGINVPHGRSAILDVKEKEMDKAKDLSRNEVLVKGLELVEDYYLLGLDQLPLSLELKALVEEAKEQAERLKQLSKTHEAISQKVKELTELDHIIDKYGADKGALIQILLDIQEQKHWLPKTALRWVSQRLGVPLAQIYHIVTFYKVFSLKPQGRHHCQVCMGTACQVRGSQRLLNRTGEILKLNPGQTDDKQRFTLSTVNCPGCCASGPVVVVDEDYYSSPSRDELVEIVAKYD
ncbi:MAG: NAD(P)H-dependent oxidoreductase subunit E [Dehalococcoidia bacterium]